ncbi:unnamed protein product [Chironomus riparius]|uniref:Uncharacterized protein n=1 Tax=Chironomus riparius TaxID=315576 RepID=A0A9N9WNY5_9DIPT|nr:unnamed protein product [Chironomus riparius]
MRLNHLKNIEQFSMRSKFLCAFLSWPSTNCVHRKQYVIEILIAIAKFNIGKMLNFHLYHLLYFYKDSRLLVYNLIQSLL